MTRPLQRLPALALAISLGLGFASPAEAERQHTVRSGQTLAAIARRYRVSVADLRAANRMRSARLRPGQTLTIPDRGVTYVRRGETLSHIARRMDVSIADLRRANRLRRNARIRPGQRIVMPGHTPREQIERDWGDPDQPGRVTLLRRSERREVQLLDTEGRVLEEGLAELGLLLRRNDEDVAPPPNPRLAVLLARISDEFGGRPIRIVSGYRPAGGRTRESSRHTSGRATDIRVHGVPHRVVWEYCRRINHAGCGFYPRSTFVHVDARRNRTQWVDWSRPGRRARYGTLRGPASRRRRLRMPRPRVAQDLALEVTLVDAQGNERVFEDRPGAEAHDVEGSDAPEALLLAEVAHLPDSVRALAADFAGAAGVVFLLDDEDEPEDDEDSEDEGEPDGGDEPDAVG